MRPALAIAFALVVGCSGSTTSNLQPARDASTAFDLGSPLDVPPVIDLPAIVDAPVAIDAPAMVDVPAAVDVPAMVDVPTAVDVPAMVDVPVAVDVPAVVDVPPTDVCGGCRPGFTCYDGLCRSASGVPAFGQVYVIVMENESQSSIRGSSNAPYINGLLGTAAVAGAYRSVAHPSLPNYIALTSGGTQGISCDCQPGTAGDSCNFTCLLFPNCNCNRNVAHLGDQLDSAGLTWRNYGQGMGAPCNTHSSGSYAVKHMPFFYYDNLRTNAARCNDRMRDLTDLAGDLGHRALSLVIPDLCHDMHDSCAPTNNAIRQGDDWLRANVAPVLAAPGFDRDGVLFIVWDEGNLSLFSDIVLIALGPLVRPGTTTQARDHYSLLATLEDGLGLPRLGMAVGAAPLREVFR
jgi:hypothetical protein